MTLSAPNNPVEARGKASKRAVSSLTAVRRTEGLTAPKRTFVVGVARPAPSLLQRAEGSLMAVQRGSRSNLSEQPFGRAAATRECHAISDARVTPKTR